MNRAQCEDEGENSLCRRGEISAATKTSSRDTGEADQVLASLRLHQGSLGYTRSPKGWCHDGPMCPGKLQAKNPAVTLVRIGKFQKLLS